MIIFSSATKLINAKYFIKIRHIVRIFCNSINMLVGFLTIACVSTFLHIKPAFFIALFSSVLIGMSSALGESITLGFIKAFPSELVGYWGTGTGFSGLFATGILLLLKSAGFTSGEVFFVVIPTVLPYFFSFYWLHRVKSTHPY